MIRMSTTVMKDMMFVKMIRMINDDDQVDENDDDNSNTDINGQLFALI